MARRIAFLFLLAAIAVAQTAAPEFVAASVKPSAPGAEYGGMRGGPGTTSPGQIAYSAVTLRAVTARAYNVQRIQIVGPPWFDQERYDIVAKVPPNTTLEQFRLMLQKLLADRFKLELHRENRTAVIYEMTVAKTGHKMTVSNAPDSGAAGAGLMESYFNDKIQLQGRRVTMRQLIVRLTDETDRPIIDKTGLTESYDFIIPWAQRHDGTAAEFGDTVYSAVEKYLGLRLVPRKEPVETFVIDRLERVPTEN
jgi:uncharacterized protein (TIGR03435 family)